MLPMQLNYLSCISDVQIDIVIVSCSCFAPTPSMAAMIVNHFKLRRDVLTYNLSGMGCSSSLICIDMVKHLLKVRLLTTDCSHFQELDTLLDP